MPAQVVDVPAGLIERVTAAWTVLAQAAA